MQTQTKSPKCLDQPPWSQSAGDSLENDREDGFLRPMFSPD